MATNVSPPQVRPGRNTGWAIVVAIVFSFIFYLIYNVLFTLVVGMFATHEPRFATGLGAWILLVVAPNVLGFLSGAVTATALFKQANKLGLFYGIVTFLIIVGGLLITSALIASDQSWYRVVSYAVTIAITITMLRVVLSAGKDQ